MVKISRSGGGSWLLLLLTTAVLVSVLFVVNVTGEDKYSNHYLMKIDGDLEEAKRIAHENHFRLVRSVGLTSANYYVVQPDHYRIRRSVPSLDSFNSFLNEAEKRISSHPSVHLFEREKVLSRKKRDYIDLEQMLANRKGSLFGKRQFSQFGKSPGSSVKVDIVPTPGVDPMWRDMWYINRNLFNKQLPDMNVTGAWSQGFSGKGISITFLDDGLEHDHPDIHDNYDPLASHDLNGNDDDPMPRYDDTNENKHGTRCAGEVAAVANNSICSVGVAYNSGIGGIRMLDGDVTDSIEARSLSFNRDHIHIYSASWGPDDNGEVVDGPGPLARQAFVEGVNLGRNGLGSIFVWASGNGGRFSDSCACDGYANSIYTLSISSTTEKSEKPWYLEECTSTLATTYSSGDDRNEREIITTDIRHQCTTRHTGTSAAAPLAAGIIALALEANPKLTWRDIMFLTVLSSRPKAIKSNNFIVNKRGFLVSSRYGFGLMDAGRMAELAKDWVNVPALKSCQVLNSDFKVRTIQRSNVVEVVLNTDACANMVNEVNYIEQVEIIVTMQAPNRGLLQLTLTSPMGTSSIILPRRPKDTSTDGFKRWAFMTVQLWGEFPRGDWKLTASASDGAFIKLDEFSLIIHGTKEKPIEYEHLMNMQSVNNAKDSESFEESSPLPQSESMNPTTASVNNESDDIDVEAFGTLSSKLKSIVKKFVFNQSKNIN